MAAKPKAPKQAVKSAKSATKQPGKGAAPKGSAPAANGKRNPRQGGL